MRELSLVEMELVEGGNPLLIAGAVIVGAAVVGGIALLAYAVYNDCDGSLEISEEGIKIEVSCSGGDGSEGGG